MVLCISVCWFLAATCGLLLHLQTGPLPPPPGPSTYHHVDCNGPACQSLSTAARATKTLGILLEKALALHLKLIDHEHGTTDLLFLLC